MRPRLTLVDWLDRHRDFERGVRAVARILPERNEARFRRVFEPLDDALRHHMAFEERELLPAYAVYAPELPPNAAVHVLVGDHDRLRAHLDAIGRVPVDGPGLRARARALVLLAEVLDHHDRREATWFKPTLDARVPAATVSRWLTLVAEEEAMLPPLREIAPSPAPAPGGSSADPLEALEDAVVQDAPLAAALTGLAVPSHPRGPALHEAVARAVEAAERAPDLVARRDALFEVLRRLRLLAAVSGR